MLLSAKVTKIVGTPNKETWSQIYTFFPQEAEQKQKRGILLVTLSLFTQGAVEVTALGHEILSRIHEDYYGELTVGVMERLTQTIKNISSEFTQPDTTLELVAVCLVENVAYLAVCGNGEVWMKRGGVSKKILNVKTKELSVASGYLEENDLLILGTEAFFRLCGEGVLKASLENNAPEEVVESLAPLVQSCSSASAIAALISKIEKSDEEEVEEIPIVRPTVQKKASLKELINDIRFKLPKVKSGELYVREPSVTDKSKRMILTVAVLLIALLAVSVFLGMKKRESSGKQHRFNQLYEEIGSLTDQGAALAKLNPAQSRDLLFQAQNKIVDLEKLKEDIAKTRDLKQKIEASLDLVVREYKITQAPVFFDLGLLAAQAQGDKMSLSASLLVVLDKSNNRIFSVDVQQKSGEILSGGDQLSKPSLVAANDNLVMVMTETGMSQIDIKDKKVKKDQIVSDSEWGSIAGLNLFTDNLYLLDKGKSAIWRYQGTSGTFGSKRNWLSTAKIDLSKVSSFAIDGSIWMVTSDGQVLKFTQGIQEVFKVTNLSNPFTNPVVIYTNKDTQNLYILDKGSNRVIVLNKAGEYQSQYEWEGVGGISDMVVSEAQKKIFLLGGSRIYAIDLK